MRTLIIGCGNILRGDDAVGPLLVRHLWERGRLPAHVQCADGGTGGMDVAFKMRGVDEVILVDACTTGAAPGTVYEVPGEEVETPPLAGINLHAFKWDHALAFARWLLKDEYPQRIRVYLIEAAHLRIGDPLSAPVDAAMRLVIERLERETLADVPPTELPTGLPA